MRKPIATLLRVDGDREITEKTDGPFIYLIQHALLLSLYERRLLTFMQLRHAESRLLQDARTNQAYPYFVT